MCKIVFAAPSKNTRFLAAAVMVGLGAGLAVELLPAAGLAGEDGPTITIQVENDFFARATNTDRHYTNGLRASWLSGEIDVPKWLARLADLPALILPENAGPTSRHMGYAFGQSIFTPDDTDSRELVRDDRPYAAWLYFGVSLHATREHEDGAGRQDVMQLELGVVGPAALGEQVQNYFHDVINVDPSKGWDNQLRNEPGVNLTFERKLRTEKLPLPETWGLESDVIPRFGATLGNVFTHFGGGATIRLGMNLRSDFGPPRIGPSLSSSESFSNEGRPGWYVFAGADARYVARNIFLDGNSFTDSHSVPKEHLIADFQLGVVATLRSVRLSYTHVFRSPEFETQSQFDQFGAFTASWMF